MVFLQFKDSLDIKKRRSSSSRVEKSITEISEEPKVLAQMVDDWRFLVIMCQRNYQSRGNIAESENAVRYWTMRSPGPFPRAGLQIGFNGKNSPLRKSSSYTSTVQPLRGNGRLPGFRCNMPREQPHHFDLSIVPNLLCCSTFLFFWMPRPDGFEVFILTRAISDNLTSLPPYLSVSGTDKPPHVSINRRGARLRLVLESKRCRSTSTNIE